MLLFQRFSVEFGIFSAVKNPVNYFNILIFNIVYRIGKFPHQQSKVAKRFPVYSTV